MLYMLALLGVVLFFQAIYVWFKYLVVDTIKNTIEINRRHR